MSERQDKIYKNLDFKLFSFITLAGAWWGLLRYYTKMDLSSENELALAVCTVAVSYFVFCPLMYLGSMLVRISVFQVSENDEVKEKLICSYNRSARAFFEWWPFVIIMAPIFVFIELFYELSKAGSLLVVVIYMFFILYCFRDILNRKDLWRRFWRCSPGLLFYVVFFAFVGGIAKILEQY